MVRLVIAVAAAAALSVGAGACSSGPTLSSLIEDHLRATANAHCIGKVTVPAECQERAVTTRCTHTGHYQVMPHYPVYQIFRCVLDVTHPGPAGLVHQRATYTAYSSPDADLGPLGDFHFDPTPH